MLATLLYLAMPIALVVDISITFVGASPSNKCEEVVMDADPGGDDAMALLMLLSKSSDANVAAVTIVGGNTGVENGSLNALLVLEVANRTDIPVYRGSPQGLVFKEPSDNFFGYDGLGDIFEKPPLTVGKEHAALALANLVQKHPGKYSILCTGPLTNVALAIHLYPGFLSDIKRMVILGGAYKGSGNKKPGAEFNFVKDPEAAAFIFSKVPQHKLVTLLPLETVNSNSFSMDWRENLLGGIQSEAIIFMNRAEGVSLQIRKQWRPYDQMAAAILLNPDLITNFTDTKIYVETCGEHGRGAMFVDYKSNTSNVRIVTDVDKQLFEKMILTLLS